MMWRKAVLFDDHEAAEQILSAPHPHRAKALGRQVHGFDQKGIEASPTDRIWGIGLAANDERAVDPAAWRGLNLLGFAPDAHPRHTSRPETLNRRRAEESGGMP
jgi:predicted NAD-dependent protein-ADP-ribosyltransferase YbiA (DUF1768 family)